MKVIGIIPARSGSKSIKDKNIKKINGKPLIYYTIKESLKSKIFDRLIVSTDSEYYMQLSRKFGAEAPFKRPINLSTNKSLAIDTIKHALIKAEKFYKEKYDLVCMLQPTTPLRSAKDCRKVVSMLINNYKNFDSVISVTDVDNYHPIKMKKIVNKKLVDYKKWFIENPPRQSLPKVYIVNGAFYLTKRNVLLNDNSFKGKNTMPYLMPKNISINIDNDQDFELAKIYLKKLNF